MKISTKKITMLAMLAALAYVVMFVGRVPIVLFLQYDPKYVVLATGGFIFGPLSAFVISVLVSLIEMFTVSDTGFIGLIMNILSTCAFACTAAFIYKKKRTLAGAVAGLLAGCVLMTLVMVLWNYLVTPIYMDMAREKVAAMLVPAFLPFNLLKGGLNTAITLLLYKPAVSALRRARLLEPAQSAAPRSRYIGTLLVGLLLLATFVLLTLVFTGKI